MKVWKWRIQWRNHYRCFLIIYQANYKKKESWWLHKVGVINELNAFMATLNQWLEVCGKTQGHIGYLLWNSVILWAIIVFKPILSPRELKPGWICNPVAFEPPCIQALHQLSSETLLLAVMSEWLNPLNTLHGELATSLLVTGEEYINLCCLSFSWRKMYGLKLLLGAHIGITMHIHAVVYRY